MARPDPACWHALASLMRPGQTRSAQALRERLAAAPVPAVTGVMALEACAHDGWTEGLSALLESKAGGPVAGVAAAWRWLRLDTPELSPSARVLLEHTQHMGQGRTRACGAALERALETGHEGLWVAALELPGSLAVPQAQALVRRLLPRIPGFAVSRAKMVQSDAPWVRQRALPDLVARGLAVPGEAWVEAACGKSSESHRAWETLLAGMEQVSTPRQRAALLAVMAFARDLPEPRREAFWQRACVLGFLMQCPIPGADPELDDSPVIKKLCEMAGMATGDLHAALYFSRSGVLASSINEQGVLEVDRAWGLGLRVDQWEETAAAFREQTMAWRVPQARPTSAARNRL